MYEDNKLVITLNNGKAVWFLVKGIYETRLDKEERRWSCTCMGYTMRPDRDCSHVLACKMKYDEMIADG